MFLFMAIEFNYSISLLLITGNIDSLGHVFYYLNCQGGTFSVRVKTVIVYIDNEAQRQSPDCKKRKIIIKRG